MVKTTISQVTLLGHMRGLPLPYFGILYLSSKKLKNLKYFHELSRCEHSIIDTLSFVILLFAPLYLELTVRNIEFGEFTYYYYLLLSFSNHVYTNDSRS